MFIVEKMFRPLSDKWPAVRSGTFIYQALFQIIYVSAIAIATLGWIWLLTRWALELIT